MTWCLPNVEMYGDTTRLTMIKQQVTVFASISINFSLEKVPVNGDASPRTSSFQEGQVVLNFFIDVDLHIT